MSSSTVRELEKCCQELRMMLLKKEEEIRRLGELLVDKDDVIQDLRSQLDKYQSVFFQATQGMPGSPGRRSPKRQRVGISAEPARNQQEVGEDSLRRYPKPPRSMELIKKAVLSNEFLCHLEMEQIMEIVECMHPVQVRQDCLIIQEGDVGSQVYVMEEGRVEVTKDNKYLSTMCPGKVFGELAILYNCTRTASVRALEPCMLWAIERQNFQAVMMKTGQAKLDEYCAMLKNIPMFELFTDELIYKIADVMEEVTCDYGEYIVRQGARGELFYIIYKGLVKVVKLGPPEGFTLDEETPVERVVGTLKAGDYFGEKALRGEDVRAASMVASSDRVVCLTIDHESFAQLMSSFQGRDKRLPSVDSARESDRDRVKLDREFEKLCMADLDVVSTLGVGGFGRVELVKLGNTDRSYALKQMKKSHIVETRQQQHILNERKIMAACNSDFIVKLYKTFKDRKYLYMVLEACLGGEVWTILRDRGSFDETTSRFYCACVMEAFEYLHRRGIIYRDLKPENMLLDSVGYAKLVDFGFSKTLPWGKKTWTFCGTPEYVAPEIILNKGHDLAVDYWSLGVLIYELLTGVPPFTANDPMKTYNLILKGVDALDFPQKVKRNAIHLIKKLCRDNPTERLGCGRGGGISDVRKHKWFEGFNFDGMKTRKLTPPIVPTIKSTTDVSNFDNYPEDVEPVPPDDVTGWDAEF